MMTPHWHTALVCLVASGVVFGEPVVTNQQTKVTYRGTTSGSVEHFMNIRFAQDTSGHRRFAPPEPYVPPEGSEVDATTPGPACAQTRNGLPPFLVGTPDISEDCLTVRIDRPAGTTADDRLPVVVHNVEAGCIKGWLYDPHIDPDALVALSASLKKPVIHVAIQSRLTIFGFARLPALKEQQSLNVGLRDQRIGVQWIKDNIAAFGGDPNLITVFGVSAGATLTSLQLVAYGGEKGVPFNQFWAMSGPPGTAVNMSSDATEIHTMAVAEKLGCLREKDEDILECLRSVSMDELMETAMAYSVSNHPPVGLFTFIPSVDDDFIPNTPTTLYRAGKFSKGELSYS
jgi:carboxylesterase type B